MIKNIYISVIIPVYNVSGKHLIQCINSILHQTLPIQEYEIILIDDSSTSPDTLDTISLLKKKEQRIQFVQHKNNLGPNEARKTGWRISNGNYIVFVDGDDLITSDALETLKLCALKTKADIVTPGYMRFNESDYSYRNIENRVTSLEQNFIKRLQYFFSNPVFSMCGCLFSAKILSNFVFDLPKGILCEDISNFCRLLFTAKVTSTTHRNLYYYRLHSNSRTSKINKEYIDGLLFGFSDWIKQARRHGILEELSKYILIGIARNVENTIKRSIAYYTKDNNLEFYKIINQLWRGLKKLPINITSSDNNIIKKLENLYSKSISKKSGTIDVFLDEFRKKHTINDYDKNSIFDEGLGPSDIESCTFFTEP